MATVGDVDVADACVDTVTMTPCNDAICYVNGTLVTETVTLKTGSRVIFGRTHVFRFMQPNQGKFTTDQNTWSLNCFEGVLTAVRIKYKLAEPAA